MFKINKYQFLNEFKRNLKSNEFNMNQFLNEFKM